MITIVIARDTKDKNGTTYRMDDSHRVESVEEYTDRRGHDWLVGINADGSEVVLPLDDVYYEDDEDMK